MSAAPTVLVVDDERPLVELVASYLQREGYRVLRAHDGPTALEIARSQAPDLIVLDIMLPGLDGLEVCRRLRTFSDAYVMMLTARADEIDTIIGLSVGADDYMTKPFSPRELVARARALLRRPRTTAPAADDQPPLPLRLDAIVIDLAAHEVTRDGESVPLTPHEFELLALLASHPGIAFARAQLIEHIWGADFYGDDHVVDVHISNLRHKLESDPARPRLIETVRGVGYRFRRAGQ